MGGKSGALGLRVSGKRASLSKRHSRGHSKTNSEVTTIAPIVTKPAEETTKVQFIPTFKGAAEMEARRRVRMQAMGARRGPQPAVETSPTSIKPPPTIITENLDPELSSSDEDEDVVDEVVDDDDSSKEEEEAMLSSDDDDDFAAGDDMDDEDEFDPSVPLFLIH